VGDTFEGKFRVSLPILPRFFAQKGINGTIDRWHRELENLMSGIEQMKPSLMTLALLQPNETDARGQSRSMMSIRGSNSFWILHI
jgi:hypothetical protein